MVVASPFQAMRCWLLLCFLTACAGVPPSTPANDCHSTEHPSLRAPRAVEPIYAVQNGKTGPTHRLLGAAVGIDPEPGTSKELLQHRFDCSAEAPLGVTGAHAVVTSGDGSYRVAITSDDDDDALEILHRAEALTR